MKEEKCVVGRNGRITIPKDMRDYMDIREDTVLEIVAMDEDEAKIKIIDR